AVTDAFVRTTVVSMLCLLPTYVFLSSSINNDNLLIALGSAILWVASRPPTPRSALGLGLLIGLALLTKLTAVVYVALVVLVAAIGWRRRTRPAAALAGSLLTLTVAAALFAPWAWRNQVVYGSLTAENVANIRQPWDSLPKAVFDTLSYMQDSFW